MPKSLGLNLLSENTVPAGQFRRLPMPSLQEIQQKIDESEPGDWQKHEGAIGSVTTERPETQIVWTYEHDVDLCIERGNALEDEFQEPWTEAFADNENNMSYTYWVYYGASPVGSQTIVSVDGHRADIPLPDDMGDTLTITSYQDNFGEIVNHDLQTYRDYLGRAEIEIES